MEQSKQVEEMLKNVKKYLKIETKDVKNYCDFVVYKWEATPMLETCLDEELLWEIQTSYGRESDIYGFKFVDGKLKLIAIYHGEWELVL